jgi:RNA polymerase sigma-70 factor (ECF subfamily)
MERTSFDPEVLLCQEDHVRRLARGLLLEREGAEDAVQETWLAAVEAGGRPKRAWLSGVLRHRVFDLLRERGRRRRRERAAARPEAGVPSTEEIVAREELRQRIVRCVLDLEEPYRSTMILRYFEELPPREVARRLGVPVETVRTRIKRALMRLRERMDEDAGGRHRWQAAVLPLAGFGGIGVSGSSASSAGILTGVLIMNANVKLILASALVLLLGVAVTWSLLAEPGADIVEPDPRVGTLESAPIPTDVSGAEGQDHGLIPSSPYEGEVGAAEDPSPLPLPFGTVNLEVVWKEDGRPAAGAPVKFTPKGVEDEELRQVRALTDPEGRLSLPRVRAGRFWAECLLGGRVSGEVEAGKEQDLRIEIPPGAAIEGTVVDHYGAPAAEAEIFLGDVFSLSGTGMVAARADQEGGFRLPSVLLDGWRQVGARKAGHAPSPLHTLLGKPGSTLELRLQLGGPGGSIRGLVLGPQGTPVAGALVVAGDLQHRQWELPDGSNVSTPAPTEVFSGPDGRFEVHGRAQGTCPVTVRTGEYALWEGSVDIVAGAARELRVLLGRGGVLMGRVRDPEGRPIARADVTVSAHETESTRTPRTRTTRLRTRTEEDGTFRLGALAPGELEANVQADGWAIERFVFVVRSGEQVDREFVLHRGPTLRGRLVDMRGEALAKWMVRATWSEGNVFDFKRAITDREGVFVIGGCRDAPYDVEVSKGSFPVVKLSDVDPSGPDLRIEVPDEAMAACHVMGRVMGPDGEPLAGARVSLFAVGANSSPVVATDLDGGFRFGPVPGGDYQVGVSIPGLPDWRSERRLLTSEEPWDLGVIRLAEPGSVEVRVFPVARFAPESVWVKVRGVGSQRGPNEKVENGVARIGRLVAGPHVVVVHGQGIATVSRPVDIRSGETTTLTITVTPGHQHVLHLVPGEGAPPLERVDVFVRAPNGDGVSQGRVHRAKDGPLVHTLSLASGTWHVEATSDTGLRGALTLTVPGVAGSPQEHTVVLEVPD